MSTPPSAVTQPGPVASMAPSQPQSRSNEPENSPQRKANVFNRLRETARGPSMIAVHGLAVVSIGITHWLPWLIFSILTFWSVCAYANPAFESIMLMFISSAMTVIYFGSIASNGAVALLIGNGILRAAHLQHYTTDALAAAIGAVGACISFFPVTLLMQFLPHDQNLRYPLYISIPLSIVLPLLSGPIGSAVLIHNHIDLHGIDVLHATRASAVGAVITGPGFFIGMPLVLSIIVSPLWIALGTGFQWVIVRSRESLEGRVYRYSVCYTYGTRGDDPEIQEEIQMI